MNNLDNNISVDIDPLLEAVGSTNYQEFTYTLYKVMRVANTEGDSVTPETLLREGFLLFKELLADPEDEVLIVALIVMRYFKDQAAITRLLEILRKYNIPIKTFDTTLSFLPNVDQVGDLHGNAVNNSAVRFIGTPGLSRLSILLNSEALNSTKDIFHELIFFIVMKKYQSKLGIRSKFKSNTEKNIELRALATKDFNRLLPIVEGIALNSNLFDEVLPNLGKKQVEQVEALLKANFGI